MVRYRLSLLARDIKTHSALERIALPPGAVASAVTHGLSRLSAPVRGAIPLSLRGLPEGIAWEELEEVCGRFFGEMPVRSAYVHLTGWKTSWVQRIFVLTRSGKRLSLVYKNAVYNDDLVPAVRDLPVKPGPPEYAVCRSVYERPHDPLAALIPATFLAEELVPGRHYRYLLEDLGSRFRRRESNDAKLAVAGLLPEVHRSMRRISLDRELLLKYDRDFRSGLLRYAHSAVARYLDASGSEAAERLLDSWNEIEGAYPVEIDVPDDLIGPVHGDPNRTNVLFDRREARFIDWEWAGLGLPHFDLAAVVKGAPGELEEAALQAFVEGDERIAIAEHRRLYRICKLERGLLDGAFLAVQALEADGKANFDIDTPLRRALATARELNN